MSADAIRALVEFRAFDPALTRGELAYVHVPFDDLTGTQRYESTVDTALRRGQRVAVVGVSGSGKTSLASSVLGPLVEGFAPLPIRVAIESPAVATEASAFARHLVSEIQRWVSTGLPKHAAEVDRIADNSKRIRERAHKFQVAPQWMEAKLDLSYELRRVAEQDDGPNATQSVERARQLLELIAFEGLAPVLLIDDTDHWLNGPGQQADASATRSRFFSQIPRLLAEDLGVAAIVAVHTSYIQDEGYQAAAGFLSPAVALPSLNRDGIRQVLGRRAQAALDEQHSPGIDAPAAGALLDKSAIDALHLNYASAGSNLRKDLMVPISIAVTLAAEAGAESVTDKHIAAAIGDQP